MGLLRRATSTDAVLEELLRDSGRNVVRSCTLLRDMLAAFPDRAELTAALVECEHEGDRITHDIIHRVSGENGARIPADAADWHALATALDDIVDYAEETADSLGLYGVEAPMEQAVALAEVLAAAGGQVAEALGAFASRQADGGQLAPYLLEIHRLENEGDRLSRDGVASLFVAGIDPMTVIRWKDIFESLEQAVDACETVAHILEGLELKRRSRR
jgi:predicted phosphate transport protein (TIGR00153 family)